MLRGFYTAASGVWTQEKRLNNVANNIANVSTVGYKQDDIVLGTFGEHMALRMNAYQNTSYRNIGPSVYMQVVDEKYTDHAQGGFEATTRPMDMSIMGEGFFVVVNGAGEEFLSRDGQFSLDDQGFLILPGFGRVQGENGDIEIGVSDFTVDTQGNVYIKDEDGVEEQINKLIIGIPDDYATLAKVNNSLYTSGGYTVAEGVTQPMIRQFQLERSNVDMSDEMSEMLASQRALQSCSQLVKMYDEMSDQANTRITRI